MMHTRQGLLILMLAATLAAAFWPASEEDGGGIVEAMARRPAPIKLSADSEPPSQPGISRFVTSQAGDLFPAQSWQPPPAKVEPVKAIPVAPELPFKFMGRWQERGKDVTYLTLGNRMLEIHPGDVLEGVWKVDRIAPGEVAFTYLPLTEAKTLRIAP